MDNDKITFDVDCGQKYKIDIQDALFDYISGVKTGKDDWFTGSSGSRDAYYFACKVLSTDVYRNFFTDFLAKIDLHQLNRCCKYHQRYIDLYHPQPFHGDIDWDDITYDDFFGGIMYAIYQYHDDDLLDLLDYIDRININDDDLSHKKWQLGFIHDCFIGLPTVADIIRVIDNWTSWDSYVADTAHFNRLFQVA